MKAHSVLTGACFAVIAVSAWADDPLDAFKGKLKEGLYEYKVEVDMSQMPGMAAGMGKHETSFQQCLTSEDIAKGRMGRGGRDGKAAADCDIRNVKTSANSASYTMACKGSGQMISDNKIVFMSDGYKMDSTMVMSQGGQTMKMLQHVDSHYLGPCKR